MVSYGMENYEYRKIDTVSTLDEITVINGIPESGRLFGSTKIDVRLDNHNEELNVLMNQNEKTEIKVEQKEVLKAPVKKGEEVGEVTYLLEGKVIARYPITSAASVEEKNFTWMFSKILEMYGMQ